MSARPTTATPGAGSAPVLDLFALIKPEQHHEIEHWWVKLSVIQRARGRWVFHEPKGLPYVRRLLSNSNRASGESLPGTYASLASDRWLPPHLPRALRP